MGTSCSGPYQNGIQADLIILLRRNIIQSHLQITYCHVYGHLDDHKTFLELTLPQKLNVMADKLAKECLLDQIRKKNCWGYTYPLEHVRIWIGGKKVTSSIKSALYIDWGHKPAVTLFQRRKIVNTYWFRKIAWTYVGKAMETYPQMFRLWVTKQVSGFNGTNRQLSCFQTDCINKCPCCGHNDEPASHLTRCTNPGRRKVFQRSGRLLAGLDGEYTERH
jgi:hypothetical protein